jgi:hypothetical protein
MVKSLKFLLECTPPYELHDVNTEYQLACMLYNIIWNHVIDD